jgi:hypothetical protein
MHARSVVFAATSVAIAVASLVGAAGAGAKPHLVADLRLTSHEPGQPSGATLHLVWPDAGKSGKPKPEKIGVFVPPAGTRINEAAIPTCTASDTELKVKGGAACPHGSALGPGHVSFISGIGRPVDPFALDNYWYHGPKQIFGLFHPQGTSNPTLAVNRVEIRGATFIARPSLPPGFPPGEKTVPKRSDQRIYRLSTPKGAFITTPPTCPRSGRWIAHAAVTYDDGSVQRATSVTRCSSRHR